MIISITSCYNSANVSIDYNNTCYAYILNYILFELNKIVYDLRAKRGSELIHCALTTLSSICFGREIETRLSLACE